MKLKEPSVIIRGGSRLEGRIRVQGAKNTALPVMAACLLTSGRTVLYNCPRISDVHRMASIMEQIGCRTEWIGSALVIDTSGEIDSEIPKGDAGQFRGSSMLLGALLARNGRVVLEQPGGCNIGKRPLNYHFMGFEKMGVCVEERDGGYGCSCICMHGADITLPYPSVGATEHLMLAAAGAEGTTTIRGCAQEPEISDLASFLMHMGIRIEGAGTPYMTIRGRTCRNASHYHIPYDRIAAATYLLGGVLTGGDITLNLNESSRRMENILKLLEQMGASVFRGECCIRLRMDRKIGPLRMETGPHPGIPTDIQPMVMAAMLQASGPSQIVENVFDARFQVCKEFEKMGARIKIEKNCAFILPVSRLTGALVKAADLRGGAALVLAGLEAEGETRVDSFSYVERGYENLVRDLAALGAQIKETNWRIK